MGDRTYESVGNVAIEYARKNFGFPNVRIVEIIKDGGTAANSEIGLAFSFWPEEIEAAVSNDEDVANANEIRKFLTGEFEATAIILNHFVVSFQWKNIDLC